MTQMGWLKENVTPPLRCHPAICGNFRFVSNERQTSSCVVQGWMVCRLLLQFHLPSFSNSPPPPNSTKNPICIKLMTIYCYTCRHFVLMCFSGELWIFVKSCLKKYDKFLSLFIHRRGIVGAIAFSRILPIFFQWCYCKSTSTSIISRYVQKEWYECLPTNVEVGVMT